MITHVNGRSRFGTCIDKCWIRSPSFPSILQVSLQATPLVPLQGAVSANEDEGEEDENDNTDLADLKKVATEVVDHRRVHVAAERDCVLCRDRQRRRVE